MSSSGVIVALERETQLVVCPHCGLPIARRTERGIVTIDTTELRFDERLRPVLVCWSCGRHTRIGKPKAA